MYKYASLSSALTLIGDLQGRKLQGTCTVDLGLKTFKNSKTIYCFLMLFGSNENKTSDGTETLFFMESAVHFTDTSQNELKDLHFRSYLFKHYMHMNTRIVLGSGF